MPGTVAWDVGMVRALTGTGLDVVGRCGHLVGAVDRDGRRWRGVWRAGGTDPEGFEAVPQAGQGGVGVAVVGAAADTVEGPAEPFEDGLAVPVGFPPVGAVVGVSVEFDGEAPASAFDHQVDAEAADPVLDFDPVPTGDEVVVDVAFEVGVEAVFGLADRIVDTCGVLAVANEPAADVIGMQLIGGNRADAPHLVLGTAGGDVDPLPVSFLGQCPDAPPFAGGDDEGQEHDVPLVALEVIGVAAADPASFHLLLAEPVDELALG
jgi:hypothetical protein